MDTGILENASIQCTKCKHFKSGTLTCDAFPKGIPKDILTGNFDHTKPHNGDNGIQFEPRKNNEKEISKNNDNWKLDFDIKKIEEDQQLVFGWLSIAYDSQGNQVEDADHDIIEESDLEQAAYNHVLKFRKAGENHQEIIGDLVESMIFTKEKQQALGIPNGILPIGWWVGYKLVKQDAWDKVKSGEYDSFSVGGRGRREIVED